MDRFIFKLNSIKVVTWRIEMRILRFTSVTAIAASVIDFILNNIFHMQTELNLPFMAVSSVTSAAQVNILVVELCLGTFYGQWIE